MVKRTKRKNPGICLDWVFLSNNAMKKKSHTNASITAFTSPIDMPAMEKTPCKYNTKKSAYKAFTFLEITKMAIGTPMISKSRYSAMATNSLRSQRWGIPSNYDASKGVFNEKSILTTASPSSFKW